jgi:hypothetical protein
MSMGERLRLWTVASNGPIGDTLDYMSMESHSGMILTRERLENSEKNLSSVPPGATAAFGNRPTSLFSRKYSQVYSSGIMTCNTIANYIPVDTLVSSEGFEFENRPIPNDVVISCWWSQNVWWFSLYELILCPVSRRLNVQTVIRKTLTEGFGV